MSSLNSAAPFLSLKSLCMSVTPLVSHSPIGPYCESAAARSLHQRPDAMQCNIHLAGEMQQATCSAHSNLRRQPAASKTQHIACITHHFLATCNVKAAQHLTFAAQQVLRPAVGQLAQLSAVQRHLLKRGPRADRELASLRFGRLRSLGMPPCPGVPLAGAGPLGPPPVFILERPRRNNAVVIFEHWTRRHMLCRKRSLSAAQDSWRGKQLPVERYPPHTSSTMKLTMKALARWGGNAIGRLCAQHDEQPSHQLRLRARRGQAVMRARPPPLRHGLPVQRFPLRLHARAV